MNLAVVGDNRPRLYWAMTAAQALGGMPVPLYQDAIANEMVYVLDDARSSSRSSRTRSRSTSCSKWNRSSPRGRAVRHLIYDDPRGCATTIIRRCFRTNACRRSAASSTARTPDSSTRQCRPARRRHGHHPLHLRHHRQAEGRVPDACGLIGAARNGCQFDGLGADDDILSYLPMAWVGDNLFSYAQALVAGFTVNCPESARP
jgi:long-chain acyl-CoA synthetase